MKVCTACGETKPLSEFSPLKARCKPCIAEYERARRAANKEHHRAVHKAWREANPDRVKAHRRTYYEANKCEELSRRHARYKANPEREKARVRQWEEENAEAATIIKVRSALKSRLGAQPPESLVETAALIKLIKREARNEKRK